jgi:transposase
MVITKKSDRIIKKFEELSLKYHKLSILMHELGVSLKQRRRRDNLTEKEFKLYIEELGLNFDKIINLSVIDEIKLNDLKGGLE